MVERSEAVEQQGVRDGSAAYEVEAEIATSEDVPPGYKRTEVGVIPGDWAVETIGSVFQPTAGGDHKPSRSSKEFRDEYEHPIYANAIQNKGLYGYANYATAKAGSITVTARGTLGHADFRKNPFVAIGRLLVLEPKQECEGFYFSEYINYGITFSVESTGVPQLTAPQVAKYPLPVPPLNEQRAIATALSDVDALIESLDRLIAKKRDIKQATMQQLLTGETRLLGFEGEWETKRLGDISTTAMGRTPSRNNTAFWGRGHVWLSIADLHGKVVKESKEQITDLAASGMSPIPEGTLLMSFKLSIGRLCFAGCDLFTNEAICSFTDLQADKEFIYYALSRTDFSLYGKQAVKGYTLNSESLKLVEVLLPPEDEQTAIAAVLSDMDAEIEALERRREKTKQIKQGMMQELLTGRVRLV